MQMEEDHTYRLPHHDGTSSGIALCEFAPGYKNFWSERKKNTMFRGEKKVGLFWSEEI